MMIERADQGFLFGSSLLTSEPPPLEKRTGKTSIEFCSFLLLLVCLILGSSETPSFWVSLHWIRMPLVCNHMLTFRYLLDFSLDSSEYVCGTNKALAISPSKAS